MKCSSSFYHTHTYGCCMRAVFRVGCLQHELHLYIQDIYTYYGLFHPLFRLYISSFVQVQAPATVIHSSHWEFPDQAIKICTLSLYNGAPESTTSNRNKGLGPKYSLHTDKSPIYFVKKEINTTQSTSDNPNPELPIGLLVSTLLRAPVGYVKY